MTMISEMPPTWSPLVIFVDISNIPMQSEHIRKGYGLLWEWLFTRDNYIDRIILVPLYGFNINDPDNDYLITSNRRTIQTFRQELIAAMQAGMMQNIVAGSVVDEGPPVTILDPTHFAINYREIPVSHLIPDLLVVGEKLTMLREYYPASTRMRWNHPRLLAFQYYWDGTTSGRYLPDAVDGYTDGLTTLADLFR